jgi:hypothetical protein
VGQATTALSKPGRQADHRNGDKAYFATSLHMRQRQRRRAGGKMALRPLTEQWTEDNAKQGLLDRQPNGLLPEPTRGGSTHPRGRRTPKPRHGLGVQDS